MAHKTKKERLGNSPQKTHECLGRAALAPANSYPWTVSAVASLPKKPETGVM